MYISHNIGRHGIWKPEHWSLKGKTFCWNLVNTWSLLFQNVDKVENFAFFLVFSVSRSQYWSNDHTIYIFFHLQNNAQLLLGTDFLFDVWKIFLRPSKWPHETNFHNCDRIFCILPCFISYNLTKIAFSCRRIFFTYRMML